MPLPEARVARKQVQRGQWVVVAGPDGAGKTTLARGLVEAFAPRPTLHLHHRFGLLPRSAGSRVPTSDPHRARPYPRWLAALKVAYLYVDHIAGWLLKVTPARRRGVWIVQERGWLDLAVDPRRYRLQHVTRLTSLLSQVAPRPDVTLLLDAPAGVMRTRTPELPLEELDRQRALWRDLTARYGARVLLDSSAPVEVVVGEAMRSVDGSGGEHEQGADRAEARHRWRSVRDRPRWARFPLAGAPRWRVPVWPRAAATAGLSVYQPMTPRALLGWSAARVIAICGGLVFFGRDQAPAEQQHLTGRIPPDALLAVAIGRQPDRAVALVLDQHGAPLALAKLRWDVQGPASLAHEAEMVERFAPLLPAGVVGPRVLERSGGALLFEPASWHPRLRPWILPVEVASGLGTLYRLGGGTAEGGAAHGDFAPWNLLRLDRGWMLVDWADATAHAMPFFDPLHYLVQAHALLGRPSRSSLVAGLAGQGWVGAALRAYATAAQLDPATARQRCAEFLLETLPKMDVMHADGRRGAAARRELLAALAEEPARSAPGW